MVYEDTREDFEINEDAQMTYKSENIVYIYQ